MATAAAAIPRTTARLRLDVGLAALIVAIAAVGFWPTYFGPLMAGAANKTPIVHLHAAVCVGCLALFVDMLVFAPFFAAASYYRRKPELHKPLMIVRRRRC